MRPFIRIIIILLFIAAAAGYSHAAERKEIVVVMPMAAQNLSPEVRSSLTESFIGELIRSDKYEIVSGKIVADAMTEAFKKQKEKKQQCDELACVREVAGNLGADLVLTIKVVKDEDVYLLNAKIENITSGAQVALKDDFCEKCKILELQKKVKLLAVRLMGLEGGETSPSVTATAKKPAVEEPHGSSFSEGGISMVFIKGGCFQMGDTFGDGDSNEKPVHEVCVDDFYMGKYEVTQKEWVAIMGSNPSKFQGCDNCPVEQVSWNDAQEFIKRLNQKSPFGKGGQGGFRLPTEAEWEYAARSGGRSEKYSGGSNPDSVGWYTSNSGSKTHPVGQKEANGLGLYDMSGNVREWCSDWYADDYYRKSPRDNPQGASSGLLRVLRGGSWYNIPQDLRASDRFRFYPDFRGNDNGFRVVRTN